MIETHAFGNFVPKTTKYLILGSFTAKEAFDEQKKAAYIWFYSNGGRNQFWPILEEVYGISLQTKKDMTNLLGGLGMAMADIIYQCERRRGSNLDVNLTNFVYNTKAISIILKKHPIQKVFFTSRFVEKRFNQIFKEIATRHTEIEFVGLPSPSPRYAAMRLNDKIKIYKQLLPKAS